EAVAYWAKLFDRTLTKEEVAGLIRTVGLADRADTLAMNLSGGEKRRLGIAMSLVGKPKLVFLDEPTTGLDPGARRELWGLIRQLKSEGTTILLTTHYLDEAEQLADDVAIMDHGKIVARGSPADLIAQHGQGHSIVLAGADLLCARLSDLADPPGRCDLWLVGFFASDPVRPGSRQSTGLPRLHGCAEQDERPHDSDHPRVGRLLPIHPRPFDQRRPSDSARISRRPCQG